MRLKKLDVSAEKSGGRVRFDARLIKLLESIFDGISFGIPNALIPNLELFLEQVLRILHIIIYFVLKKCPRYFRFFLRNLFF